MTRKTKFGVDRIDNRQPQCNGLERIDPITGFMEINSFKVSIVDHRTLADQFEAPTPKTHEEWMEYDKWLESKEKKLEQMREATKSLTPRQRQILTMWLEGKTQAEIAKELGVLPTAIGQTFSGTNAKHGGIIKKLRKTMKNKGVE